MFIVDTLLVGSLRFVLDKLVAAAEAEMNDDSALREQLLEAQMRLELGEITDAEFEAIERDILARIREMKGSQQGEAFSMSGEVKVDLEAFEERAGGSSKSGGSGGSGGAGPAGKAGTAGGAGRRGARRRSAAGSKSRQAVR
jgi:Gas vesicle protein G